MRRHRADGRPKAGERQILEEQIPRAAAVDGGDGGGASVGRLDRDAVVVVVDDAVVDVEVDAVGVDAVRVQVLGLQRPLWQQLDELIEQLEL